MVKVFTLIQDDDMWVTSREGAWVNRVWVDGVPTITKLSGLFEPYQHGETSLILPQGVSSEDAVIIYTEHILNTYNNLTDNITEADLVTLQDPTLHPNTFKYMVLMKELWSTNTSFTLIPSHNVYIAKRVEQQ